MSSPLAIAAVSAVLKNLLDNAVADDSLSSSVSGSVNVTLIAPNRIKTDSSEKVQLNLYLYQVTRNTGWGNADLPSRNDRGDRLTNPPLALNLHYLLTAYGNKDFEAEILLGYAMHILYETPVLTREAIRTTLTSPSPVSGTPLPSPLDKLLASGLADQIEQIKITPDFLSTEEMSKLWTAMQVGYHISMAYQASVVLIQGQRPTRVPLPVRERRVHVQTFQRPVIDEVSPQMVEPGEALVLKGQNLNAGTIQVKFGATAVGPDSSTGQMITVKVPAGLQAGVNTVQVVQSIDVNSAPPPDLRRGFASNAVAFMLRPKIKIVQPPLPEPVLGAVPRGTDLTLQVSPPVGHMQDVQLLLDNRSVGLKPLKPTDPPPPPVTTSLTFAIPSDFPTGEFLARVQVDGAQSKLILDPNKKTDDLTAAYTGPKLEVVCNSKCLRCQFAPFNDTAAGVEVTVTIKDENAANIQSAEASATWTLPDGTTLDDSQTTDANGEAKFSVIGGSGTYVLTINDVTKKDFALDQQKSTLTQNHVK